MSITQQQRWNRYVHAINYCISLGYYIDIVDSIDNDGDWNGNIHAIRVQNAAQTKECIIKLKPKKYRPTELYYMIVERIGYAF